jgi:hypothetical protein
MERVESRVRNARCNARCVNLTKYEIDKSYVNSIL